MDSDMARRVGLGRRGLAPGGDPRNWDVMVLVMKCAQTVTGEALPYRQLWSNTPG